MKCDAQHLCKKIKLIYNLETGICPESTRCDICYRLISCTDGKYVLDNENYCPECYDSRGWYKEREMGGTYGEE